MSVVMGLYLIRRDIIPNKYLPKYKYLRIVAQGLKPLVRKISTNLRSYSTYVMNQPDRVEEYAKELEPHIREFLWNFSLDVKNFRIITKTDVEVLIKGMGKFIRDIKKVNFHFGDALDLFTEHIIMRLKWLLEEPHSYIQEMSKFMMNYRDDAYEYAILLISSMLLLKALGKRIPVWLIRREDIEKQELLVKKFLEVAEELESYTAIFQLIRNPIAEEEMHIIGSASSPEELRRLLNIE